MSLRKVKNPVVNLHDKTEYFIHITIKTGIKSWNNFEKSS